MTFNLSPQQELPLTTRRTVQRALSLLEHHLREPARHSRPQRLSGTGCA